MPYFVYILRTSANTLYIGQTNNVAGRLKLHNAGKVNSTKSRAPFKLVGYKEFKTRSESRWVEFNLKHHSDKKEKFIKGLI